MKIKLAYFLALIMILSLESCKNSGKVKDIRIIFLHHSTGQAIWDGNGATFLTKVVRKISPKLSRKFYKKSSLPWLFDNYNGEVYNRYVIEDLIFPKKEPYSWNNFPYDYYNIWVRNAGNETYMEEPTLEILTKTYQVIVFKHCFPVSNIQSDRDTGDINSDYKSIANYKLQYLELRHKLLEFPRTRFILFTGAAQVKSQISEEDAKRAREFFDWVVQEWDMPDDNIYIWDFYNLQTEGGIYFKDSNAYSTDNSHPNMDFSGYASELLFNRIIDVITSNGARTNLKGEWKSN
jgi:hypothetical protein